MVEKEESDFTKLFTGKKPYEILLRLDPNQIIQDEFLNARVSWINQFNYDETINFVLKIRKGDKRKILQPYLQHIHIVKDELEEMKPKPKLKLYINVKPHDRSNKIIDQWRSVPFTHPSIFETIATESDLKNKVKADLESSMKAKQYYNRLGRVWKQSFLLYDDSSTGKSSFVTAMANFLGYDVYDVDLSKISDDSDLKLLLLQTTSKSVIVIELLLGCSKTATIMFDFRVIDLSVKMVRLNE